VRQFETWNHLFPTDYACDSEVPDSPPLIRLGAVPNQWYSGVSIAQDVPDKSYYTYNNLDIYVIPSERVVERSTWFNCSDMDRHAGVVLKVRGVYFLRGTNVTFNVCIHSTDRNDGWVDIDFYDSVTSYFSEGDRANNTLHHHRFHVGANTSFCYTYNYTAPRDSYYYIVMGEGYQINRENITVTFYRMTGNMKYAKSSELLGKSRKLSCNCSVIIAVENGCECPLALWKDIGWVFHPEEYKIFARVTSSPSLSNFGHLTIQPSFRDVSYAIPTIGGLMFLVPAELICIASVCCCLCRLRRRTQVISDAEELRYGIQS
jgi:hypothetical protein